MTAELEQLGGLFETERGDSPEEIVASVREHDARALTVHRLEAPGEDPRTDVSWLSDLADQLVHLHVRIVKPKGWDSVGVMPHLESLRLDSWSGRIDFGRFPALRHLGYASKGTGVETLAECGAPLESFGCGGWHEKDLSAFGKFALADLTLSHSRKLRCLDGLQAHHGSIESLEIVSGSVLQSLDGLAGAEKLMHLALPRCHRLRDLAPIAELPALRWLVLENNRDLPSLEPLAGHPSLEVVMLIGINYLDLDPLLKIPGLRHVALPRGRRTQRWQDVLPRSQDTIDELHRFLRR